MLTHTTEIRVRYADTDKMQFVYNGKYLEYFEVGRTELLRSTGLSYAELEKNGYQLPLIEANVKYKNPAYYDDILEIEASVKELYSPKVHIEYVIRRKETKELIAEGFTTHIFIKTDTKKAVRPPQIYVEALKQYF
ncbi:MAG: thioesterase family protein [Melioribacter sp.]|uniref:acyl-CoA thioesterase n=1 Tax=Rosettibacter primus TaxID=3111523 RepID=UPI00247CA24D|nr:thioesterase family protein [Melioribacter sp.]